MPNSKIKISFNIDAWTANSLGLSQPDEWKEWAASGNWPQDGKVNVADIPAMIRRRMSPLSKLAVQTAIELLKQHQVDYLVFSSRHGELHRSVALVADIISGEEASPMAFSQSVHNTAAGLATIATKQPIPLTSIAASENTFQSAILEAWLFLADNPDKKVLLVDFDEPLPESYSEFEQQQYPGFGLGLVLSNGDDFTLRHSHSHSVETQDHLLPQGLAFLQNYLSDETQWTIHAPQQAWEWRKK
ncbi:beta-ketoacyl synthase chain length factor [Vibrio parahaemolyticus]|uniref:beta-ketoacyl synthase chain length factor n=1 Tax=Vibrio parahaemolyticus TaxID=670 RepID=UPI0006A5B5F8|nr:beta-ketoacyl synthase chain length factor [Vibrio parahaemolyticus]EGQ8946030.1 3-oxoacyl-ACP synthase [Vibrio parahaemolyticus]EGR3004420.1 3-oxoacyl-ACP synthase [Vibrio parahaemolyticus]EGR3142707.1 3-oxoacyl-ACP synthase [Vibrio parahaemolyticus]EGR3182122.1 3-oxoacyl-ACP synthase [Vibrio parahaemolyticus]EGR3196119.1 3-oxoacyl-ACP synthase [Vibrio parahaemolyticus]